MFAVLAAFLVSLVPPAPATRPCITSCRGWDDAQTCWYELRETCKTVCVPTETRECKPLIVNLGPWDPVLFDWVPAPWKDPEPSRPEFVSHLNDPVDPPERREVVW